MPKETAIKTIFTAVLIFLFCVLSFISFFILKIKFSIQTIVNGKFFQIHYLFFLTLIFLFLGGALTKLIKSGMLFSLLGTKELPEK